MGITIRAIIGLHAAQEKGPLWIAARRSGPMMIHYKIFIYIDIISVSCKIYYNSGCLL